MGEVVASKRIRRVVDGRVRVFEKGEKIPEGLVDEAELKDDETSAPEEVSDEETSEVPPLADEVPRTAKKPAPKHR
jgi:hypothetical protein